MGAVGSRAETSTRPARLFSARRCDVMQRLLGVCCCLLAFGLATRAAGLSDDNAIEEADKSPAVNSDVATNLRNIRAADPAEKDKKKRKKKAGKISNGVKNKKDQKK